MSGSRKHLSTKGLLNTVREGLKKVRSPRVLVRRTTQPISLLDCLMAGLAVFGMKFPSLLQFEEHSHQGGMVKRNLRTLYQVGQVPSDTYLRERLDECEPAGIQQAYRRVFASVQRGKVLEGFSYWQGHYLMPIDMTGFFSSPAVHCHHCCEKRHTPAQLKLVEDALPKTAKGLRKNTYLLFRPLWEPWQLFRVGENQQLELIDWALLPELQQDLGNKSPNQLFASDIQRMEPWVVAYHASRQETVVTYYHHMLCAALVHPDKKTVLPFAPEPVMKSDGATKNDCERNAAKRLIATIRRQHPHLKLIVVQDAIASNYPNLQQLKDANMRYIVGAKPGDHKALFESVNRASYSEHHQQTADGKTQRYRYLNQVPLNASHPDFLVNFLEYWETNRKGEAQHFSWVTDIPITADNLDALMRGGRANWKIENETFNTLKNQGYHFSHNFGHGYQNLCTVFAHLMLLAFLIDQVQETACDLFQRARAQFITRKGLWRKIQSLFLSYYITSWDDLWNAIAFGHAAGSLLPNTS